MASVSGLGVVPLPSPVAESTELAALSAALEAADAAFWDISLFGVCGRALRYEAGGQARGEGGWWVPDARTVLTTTVCIIGLSDCGVVWCGVGDGCAIEALRGLAGMPLYRYAAEA